MRSSGVDRRTKPTYRLTGFNRASVLILWGATAGVSLIVVRRELARGRAVPALVAAVILIAYSAALTRHVVRMATVIELDGTTLRWRNALGRWRSRPLESLVSIAPFRVGVSQVFAFKDGTTFKTSTRPGHADFVAEVAARGRGVEVRLGLVARLGDASSYLGTGFTPTDDQDAPNAEPPTD
jgi:hypothetical protein